MDSLDLEDDPNNTALTAQKLQHNKKTDSAIILNNSAETEVDEVKKNSSSKTQAKVTPDSQQSDGGDVLVEISSKRVTRSAGKKKSEPAQKKPTLKRPEQRNLRQNVDASSNTAPNKAARKKPRVEKSPSKSSLDGNLDTAPKKAKQTKATAEKQSAAKRSSKDANLESPPKKTIKKKPKVGTSENSPDKSVKAVNFMSNSCGKGKSKTRGRGRTGNKNVRLWLPADPLKRAIALSAYHKNNPEQCSGVVKGRDKKTGKAKPKNKNVRMWLPIDPYERAQVLSNFEF